MSRFRYRLSTVWFSKLTVPGSVREHSCFVDSQTAEHLAPGGLRAFRAAQRGERHHFVGIGERRHDDRSRLAREFGMKVRRSISDQDIRLQLEVHMAMIASTDPPQSARGANPTECGPSRARL